MKKTVTYAVAASVAVVCSAGLQAGEEYVAPVVAPPTAATCPWGIAAEALFLKAHSNEDEFGSQDEEWGWRLELSYKQAGNLGYRLRYFDWEGTGSWAPEMTTWDLEVFDDFELGNWTGQYALGLRYAEYTENGSEYDYVDFDGWGPTLGVELMHELAGSFSIYASGRASLVYGDDDSNYDDSFVPILELGLGLQYDFTLFRGCQSYVRVGMEAQNWASISNDDNEDTGLFGLALKFGTSF